MTSILCGLDGATPVSCEALTHALAVLREDEASPLLVDGVDVALECSGSGGHSAVLNLAAAGEQHSLFMKKITAAAMAQRPWADRRRSLAYARTEVRFYQEFAPRLRSSSCRIPRVASIEAQLEALGEGEVSAAAGEEPTDEQLQGCGAIFILEPALEPAW